MMRFTTLTGRAAVVPQAAIAADFPLGARDNRPILVAGAKFGCAIHVLLDAGVRCVLASGFDDGFIGNASKSGLLTVALPPDQHALVCQAACDGVAFTVDLGEQQICFGSHRLGFRIDALVKRCLRDGLDDISLTQDENVRIRVFEAAEAKRCPWSVPG